MKTLSKLPNVTSVDTNIALSPIRVKRTTFEKMTNLLLQVNKKDFGRRLRSDDLVCFALALVSEAHIKELQDMSLSNHDRFEAMYKEHIAKKGVMSKDAFFGLLLNKRASGISTSGPA